MYKNFNELHRAGPSDHLNKFIRAGTLSLRPHPKATAAGESFSTLLRLRVFERHSWHP